jgi:hypothetical protein
MCKWVLQLQEGLRRLDVSLRGECTVMAGLGVAVRVVGSLPGELDVSALAAAITARAMHQPQLPQIFREHRLPLTLLILTNALRADSGMSETSGTAHSA